MQRDPTMTPISQEDAYERIEDLRQDPSSWVVVLVPTHGRDTHLSLLAGQFYGADGIRLHEEDPVALANADERRLIRLLRESLSEGRLPVFVTEDATWDPASLRGPERHSLVHIAIREFALPRDRRRPNRGIEGEEGIIQWSHLHYPEERDDLRKKLLNLMEESAELVVELGHDPREMADKFLASAARAPSGHDRSSIKGAAGEIGDVGIAIVDIAGLLGLNALACRTAKMEINALKTPEESQARQKRKREMGI